MRVRTDGKFFALGDARFRFRATSFGMTQTPDPDDLRRRLVAWAESGFTVVEVPALPPQLVELALASGMRFLLRAELPWQALRNATLARRRRIRADMVAAVLRQLDSWNGSDQLLGVVLGCDLPEEQRAALGAPTVDGTLNLLADELHRRLPGLLVTAVVRKPVPSPAPMKLDFLTFDPAGIDADVLPDALDVAHRSVGDAPLVLGPLMPASVDELDQLALAGVERGVGGWWTAQPPGQTAARVRDLVERAVEDLPRTWPSVSVVICAYNAEETLEECLAGCDRLGYPALEVLVIDDGSTDATPVIADAHPKAKRITVPHVGLSAARNAGYRAAAGELVAYLDSDAYPPPEWLHYLVLALDGSASVAGCGGPNVPPPNDPLAAHIVARSPGGPIPQLRSERRAVHVPGCNMAFTREVLEKLDGFEETFWYGSEDLEFQWRYEDAGYEIGYHPAALVWHHRRPGLRRYLRQQRGYGRSQAIVEACFPDRFPRGHRLQKLRGMVSSSDELGAPTPLVAYRALYWRDRSLVTIGHQWGMPGAVLLTLTAPLGLVRRSAALPAAAGLAYMAGLFALDAYLCGRDNPMPEPTISCRARIALHRVARPLAFRWGHLRQQWLQHRA